ncbi:hypothetical protein [Stappia sp.]|uniref:hypothetical protein n=1 Tax=Stappia sp. TaxID=1870903 RepID=UPI003C7B7D87
MIDLRVFLTAALLGAVVLAGSGPAYAIGPSLYDQPVKGLTSNAACETKRDYRRLLRQIDVRRDRHMYYVARNKKYPIDNSLPHDQKMASIRQIFKKLQADRKELEKIHAKSKYGYPLDVKCRPIPRKTLVVEKNSRPFDVVICVRAKGWPKCLWTEERRLYGLKPSKDRKTWSPR